MLCKGQFVLLPITMPISVKSAESLSFLAPPEGRKHILRYYSFRFYPIITQMGTPYLYSDVPDIISNWLTLNSKVCRIAPFWTKCQYHCPPSQVTHWYIHGPDLKQSAYVYRAQAARPSLQYGVTCTRKYDHSKFSEILRLHLLRSISPQASNMKKKKSIKSRHSAYTELFFSFF